MMSDTSNIKISIIFTDELDDEEKNQEVQKLLTQMKSLDEVEDANPVIDPNPPENNKAGGGFLIGRLMAEIKLDNITKVFGWLKDRLGNKPIKLHVKAPDGREINIDVGSKEEFELIWQKAEDFLKK